MENQIESTEPKRGGCLTAFLVFSLIVNSLTAIYYLVAGASVRQALPSMPSWAIPVLIVLAGVNVIFVVAVWKWKKWGVYGFTAVALIAFVINLMSVGFLGALFGLIGLGILIFLLRNVWSEMD